jgi:hypothetical protein
MKENANQSYALNVFLDQPATERFIKTVEESLTQNRIKMNEMLPFFEAAKADFEKWQGEVKHYNDLIKADETIYEMLISYRNSEKKTKHVRLTRTTSVLEKPAKEGKRVYMNWLPLMQDVFERANRFMSSSDLFDSIVVANPEIPDTKEMKAKFETNLSAAKKRHLQGLSGEIVWYNGRFGLARFVDKNNIPLPEYLFMKNQSNVVKINKAS